MSSKMTRLAALVSFICLAFVPQIVGLAAINHAPAIVDTPTVLTQAGPLSKFLLFVGFGAIVVTYLKVMLSLLVASADTESYRGTYGGGNPPPGVQTSVQTPALARNAMSRNPTLVLRKRDQVFSTYEPDEGVTTYVGPTVYPGLSRYTD